MRSKHLAAAMLWFALLLPCQSETTLHADPPSRSAQGARFDPDSTRIDPNRLLSRVQASVVAGDPPNTIRNLLSAEAFEAAPRSDQSALHFALARSLEANDLDRALDEYALVTDGHPLSGWARFLRTKLISSRDAAAARELFLLLSSERAPYATDAALLAALSAARSGDRDAEAQLRQQRTRTSDPLRAEIELTLAEIDATRASPASRTQAASMLQAIDARAPRSRAATAARTALRTLIESAPTSQRAALGQVPVQLAFERAEALALGTDHRATEQEFSALAQRVRHDATQHCKAELGRGRAMYRRRARREAAIVLTTAASRCSGDPDARAWARFYAAKSLSAEGRFPEARAQYDLLAEEAGEHRLADDAWVLSARLALEESDVPNAMARLNRAIAASGDQVSDARFLLALLQRKSGESAAALATLEQAIESNVVESGEDALGRSKYWRARLLGELGREGDAIEAFRRLSQELPHTYYGQEAQRRLQGLAAPASDLTPLEFDRNERLTFAPRAELESAGFERAKALLSVGEVSLAERELDALGLLSGDTEGLWLVASLYDRAGAFSRSLEIARRRLRESLLANPRSRARWRIAYPRAFAPVLDEIAAAGHVPASFVRAIGREESSFRPNVVSSAQAHGVLQLLRATAQRYARPLGLRSDPTSLHTPAINLRIGTAYMGALGQRYAGQLALVPSAYNAGEGAVDRWLSERGSVPLDDFIEEIPYEETRRYTRRVLQSWGVYSMLDEGRLPSIPQRLPPARTSERSSSGTLGEPRVSPESSALDP